MEEKSKSKYGFEKSNISKGGLLLKLKNDNCVCFSKAEALYYDMLFTLVDSDEDGYIRGPEGAVFLRRASISDDILREVWRHACGGSSRPCLGMEEWFLALKLVALAQYRPQEHVDIQNVSESEIESMKDPKFLPLPNFGIQPLHALKTNLGPVGHMYPKSECLVSINKVETIGTGMSKFTLYTLTVRSSLPYSPRPISVVKRRYSDCRWLNKYLQKKFPATIIPPLPTKKYVGNFDSNFIEERRLDLQYYIDNLARHSKLSNTLEVQVMLDATRAGLHAFKNLVEKDLIAFTFMNRSVNEKHELYSRGGNDNNNECDASFDYEGSLKEADTSYDTNSGVGWLKKIVKKVTDTMAPLDALEEGRSTLGPLGATRDWIIHFRQTLDTYEKNIVLLLNALEDNIRARRDMAYNISRIASYVQRMAEVEFMFRNAATIGEGDVNNDFDLYIGVGKNLDTLANHQQDTNDSITEEIIGGLRYEVGMVRSVNHVLRKHDNMVEKVVEAHRELAKCQKSYAAARAETHGSSNTAQVEKNKVALAENYIRKLESNLVEMHDCVLEEMKHFEAEKKDKISCFVARMAQLCGIEDTTGQVTIIRAISSLL